MKIGVRKPSIKRSIKARTTGKAKRAIKRAINPAYGKKGMGLVNNPKKAVYNKAYNKTTIGINDVVQDSSNNKKTTTSINYKGNYNKNYNIIDANRVVIGNNEYSIKSIKIFKNIFISSAVLLTFAGIICLPVGLIFILFGLFMYAMFRTYKKIYIEMLNFKNENKKDIL